MISQQEQGTEVSNTIDWPDISTTDCHVEVRHSAAISDSCLAISTRFLMDWAGVDLSSSTTRRTRCRTTCEQSDQQHRSGPSIRRFISRRRTLALWSPGADRWRRLRPSRKWRGSAPGRTLAARRRLLVQCSRWLRCTARIDCVPWDMTTPLIP